jgi:hypothetical protein
MLCIHELFDRSWRRPDEEQPDRPALRRERGHQALGFAS